MASVGLSQNADTLTATREAIERARGARAASWILAVVGRRHDPGQVLAEIQRVFPGVPVYGGSCVGAIGGMSKGNRIGYSGNEVALGIFGDDFDAPEPLLVESLEDAEGDAGRHLGEWIATRAESPAVLLFYDVVREGGGINFGSRLLDGIYDRLPEQGAPQILGAGLIADFQVTRSFLFDGRSVRRNAALALALPPSLEIHARVMHACTPVSAHMTVTRAEGARIYELDGRPAVDVLRELAGASADEELALAFSVLFGRRMGNEHAPYEEAEYINRLIIDVDLDDGSVGLFEEDIRPGDRVQVMARNNGLLMESVQSGVREILEETTAKDRVFALYIDCAGRASVFTGSESEESEHLLRHVNGSFPTLGFYVGREIASFAGRSRPLDWTGVLAIISRRRAE